jgi:CRISPR/Cas system CMR-associated protein Cmr5 small subunit
MPATTIDSKIAETALHLVQKFNGNRDEYKAACEQLTSMIRIAGLPRTLQYLKAKGGAKAALGEHLSTQLCALFPVLCSGVVAGVNQASVKEFRAYTEFSIRIAVWHKRFAQTVPRVQPASASNEVSL